MHNKRKTSLLVFTDWFVPGYRAGGPIRSTANMVAALGDHFDISIVTSDRDFGSDQPYSELAADQWLPYCGNARVIYLSPQHRTFLRIGKVFAEVDADCVYLNSMFSPIFTMAPLWHLWRGCVRGRVVIAPRGMLHAGAIRFHPGRKQSFLLALRAAGVWSRVWFHATDQQESKDIRSRLGISAERVQVLANLPEPPVEAVAPIPKISGSIRLLYLSRITPKKQLLSLVKTLAAVPKHIDVSLTVAGPVEDAAYWQLCRNAMTALPPNVAVQCVEAVPHGAVRQMLESHHFFVLPTLGENYGHGIIEALGAGRPVIISDQTPWRGLEAAGVGWDVAASDNRALLDAICAAALLNQAGYDSMAHRAWLFAKSHTADPAVIEGYRRMLGPA